jgi:hypothetical protein
VEDTRRLLQNLMDLNCQIRKIWELCCSWACKTRV